MSHANPLPVAVIGAGPVGLAAAAHLLDRGLQPLVLEAGERGRREHPRVGARARLLALGVQRRPGRRRAAGAPRLDRARRGRLPDRRRARRALPGAARGDAGDRAGAALGARVRRGARAGLDKLKDAGRDEAPFELRRRRGRRRAPISGRARSSTPRAPGRARTRSAPAAARARRARARRSDRLRHPRRARRATRARYAGRRVVVVGSGHSAFNALLDLVELRESEPATQIVWAVRGGAPGRMFGGGGDDELPARGALGARGARASSRTARSRSRPASRPARSRTRDGSLVLADGSARSSPTR